MSMLTKWNPLARNNQLGIPRSETYWNPLREMDDLMRGIQRSLDIRSSGSEESMILKDWTPSVDVTENDKEYVIKAELPEVEKQDIKVNVEDGILSISGERRIEKEENGTKFHRLERAYGRFERTFGLPDETEQDKITSNYKDGILTVHLPKNPAAKPTAHQITVH